MPPANEATAPADRACWTGSPRGTLARTGELTEALTAGGPAVGARRAAAGAGDAGTAGPDRGALTDVPAGPAPAPSGPRAGPPGNPAGRRGARPVAQAGRG